ncbi:MAG: helix-turn-helix domain-containing protein [Actinomycetota bacterium]
MTILGDTLERDRVRAGLSVPQAARRLKLAVPAYRRLLAEGPRNYAEWERICEGYGWPRTFVSEVRR